MVINTTGIPERCAGSIKLEKGKSYQATECFGRFCLEGKYLGYIRINKHFDNPMSDILVFEAEKIDILSEPPCRYFSAKREVQGDTESPRVVLRSVCHANSIEDLIKIEQPKLELR